MKILALDTSSAACSVAFLSDSESRMQHEIVTRQHAKRILSSVEQIVGPDSDSLDALAWGCGPGSFTGLRIAASVVQALAFAYQLPVINVSSLAALAQTAYQAHGWRRIRVAVDARMQEIYWGAYQINEAGYAELVNQESLCPLSELSTKMENTCDGGAEWYGVGNAWSVYEKELESCSKYGIQQVDSACLPQALAVAQLGQLKYRKGQWLHSFDALPTYLRDNVCKIS